MASAEEVLAQLREEMQQIRQQQQVDQRRIQESEATIQRMGQAVQAGELRVQQAEVRVQEAEARVTKSEEERTAMYKLVSRLADSDIVDSKAVGQPFKFTGKKDSDFSEWSHKLKTFILAKYGEKMERALKWATKQRKAIVKTPENEQREISYDLEFGDLAAEFNAIGEPEKVFRNLYTYLISFTSGEANRVVRNAGDGQGLEAWRRLNNEYDPTSATRRVTILGYVQNPPKCEKIEELGQALEDWLSKKKQYEEFTDRNNEPCRVSEDSLMAAMYRLMPKSLEETVMFKQEDYDSFETLFDKLVSYASTKHSLRLSDQPQGAKKDPNAMDVGGLTGSPGGAARKDNIQCWVCYERGHMGKDCPKKNGGRPKGQKGDGKGRGDPKGGKGKGGFAGCYLCGGPHYAASCPKGKGKGHKGKGKGGPKGGKGKGKAKGNHPLNALEQDWWYDDQGQAWWPDDGQWQQEGQEDQGQEEAPGQNALDVGSMEAAALGGRGPLPYVVDYGGEKWIRFNYDSGAAATALPVDLAQGVHLEKIGEFMTASGEVIPNYGKVKFKTVDEDRNPRVVRGSVTEVHKPLGAAAELSQRHDAVLWEEGGFLIPKGSWVARRLRKELRKLLRKGGRSEGVLPLYREGNLYNFYLKKEGPTEVAPLGEAGRSEDFLRQASQGP